MELPLFPLNTVLFPGMPLSLHIFEERYKEMINRCITERIPFGVVLIESGTEALGPLAQPYSIGCTAKITQVQPLTQGRMNLVAIGDKRFRIQTLDVDTKAYLQGEVEAAPMRKSTPEVLQAAGGKLRPYVVRYLEILAQAGDVQFNASQLPTDPLELANLAAFLLRVEPDQKQALLEAETTGKFVNAVSQLYARENALMEIMVEQSGDDPQPFSPN